MTDVRLSSAQRSVVEHGHGAVLVVAGPGTGKTRVIIERVRHLLTTAHGHFHVLALTFTNRAAAELEARLETLGEKRQRVFAGTFHKFCLEVLAARGAVVGVGSQPHVFDDYRDRKEILVAGASRDPLLAASLERAPDLRTRDRLVERWLTRIASAKSRLQGIGDIEDEVTARALDVYNAGLRACGAYDFDDLLGLTHQLFTQEPRIADFYRRLYHHICVDEAQDLNEAQYAVLVALCGDEYRNVVMVGDPNQSIYGFNASSPRYMQRFQQEFQAERIELKENFRCARAVVDTARSLEPTYMVSAQLPVAGEVRAIVGENEKDEADRIVAELRQLLQHGHRDIEGAVTASRCAILGRTRYALLSVEAALLANGVAHYKRVAATRDAESDVVREFHLGMRVLVNPQDRLHLVRLLRAWNTSLPDSQTERSALEQMEAAARETNHARAMAVVEALRAIADHEQPNLMGAVGALATHAGSYQERERIQVTEDIAVLRSEWDSYLRASGRSRTLLGFLNSRALGVAHAKDSDGVALLTVHSSKGLEFDVVFVLGLAEGVFPDYRAEGNATAMAEEQRNAFVAVTRSRRLLFLSYPRQRVMPWGDTRQQRPSRYLVQAGLVSGESHG